MEKSKLRYSIKTAVQREIAAHLRLCDRNFQPSLSERVNIDEYSRKIFDQAITFEAWSADVLIGLLAVYFNYGSESSAYITNVSVLDDFARLGIASKLLMGCVEYAAEHDIREVRLAVHETNHAAMAMYKKFGFVPDGLDDQFLKMRLIVPSQ